MKNRFLFQTLVAFAALALTTSARSENQRVLLVHAGASDPMTTHLVDELIAAGFSVEVIPAGDYDVAALAKERHARAVVRVEPSHRGIALWTDTKATTVRIEEKPEEKGDLATLSLRAVEELRGELLAAPPPPKDPIPTEPPPPPELGNPARVPIDTEPRTGPVRPVEPRHPRLPVETGKPLGHFWLHMAPSAIVHPGSGGMSAGATGMLGGRWMFLQSFGAELFGTFPIAPSTVTSPAGNVNIAASAILLGGWVDVVRPAKTIVWGLGAGAGGGVFHHYGQPQTAGIQARDGNVAYALPYVRTALIWSILPSMALRADLLAAIATPRPVLRLPDRNADVYFGQPLLTIGLGLDLKLK